VLALPSRFHRERPPGAVVDTVVVHSMFAEDAAEPFDPRACKAVLDRFEVSAHRLIDRAGRSFVLVPDHRRAAHAGQSRMADGRIDVNDFSLGVELIGGYEGGFTDAQYAALLRWLRAVAQAWPLRFVLGHRHVAPERKTDPWGLDWARLESALAAPLPGVRGPIALGLEPGPGSPGA
jgi:AmpD protein